MLRPSACSWRHTPRCTGWPVRPRSRRTRGEIFDAIGDKRGSASLLGQRAHVELRFSEPLVSLGSLLPSADRVDEDGEQQFSAQAQSRRTYVTGSPFMPRPSISPWGTSWSTMGQELPQVHINVLTERAFPEET
jgi:hypothetical protein